MLKTAVITGGSNGIGRATALKLSGQGCRIVIFDQDGDGGRELEGQIVAAGGSALFFEGDVATEDSVEALYRHIVNEGWGLDILINNVGIAKRENAVDLSTEDWNRVVDCNLNGSFYHLRGAGRIMTENRGGSIVSVSSIMGLRGNDLYPNLAYHATKAAIVNMTRALAVEWAQSGVRVNAVAPAFVSTQLTDKLLSIPEMHRGIIDRTPLGRLVEAEDVAEAIAFLAGDSASMITGQTLAVDGGWTAK